MGCLDKIIGLSRKTATCFTGKPATDTSLSDLWIDEIEPLKNLSGAITSENTTVWTAMVESRDVAIKMFTADINRSLITEHEQKRSIFKGGIGDANWTSDLQTSGNYSFVRIYCDRVKGAYLKINKIGTLFAETGTVSLSVFDRLGTSYGTLTLNKTANVLTQNTSTLLLPMWSEYADYVEYFFVYSNTGNTPKNNKLWCDCSGRPYPYNLSNCDFNRRVSNRFGWANWLMIGGTYGDDFTTIRQSTSANDYAMGLLFDVELKCEITNLICQHLDFTYNPLAMSIAQAVYFKTGELILARIINNAELKRETQLNQANYEKFMIDYKTKYEQLIKDITMNVDLSLNDCLMCRRNIGNFKLLS
jgi:hypothetical protein